MTQAPPRLKRRRRPGARLYIDRMTNARLFIALFPDSAVREELAAWRDAWTWPRAATPVKTVRLHVTLHFLGDVAQEHIAQLADAIGAPFTPFTLRLTRAVLWPHGLAVLEPAAIPDPLLTLHTSLAGAVRDLALPVDERPFRPHVTLARRANSATPPGSEREVTWLVSRFALMASTLGTDGAYTLLREYRA